MLKLNVIFKLHLECYPAAVELTNTVQRAEKVVVTADCCQRKTNCKPSFRLSVSDSREDELWTLSVGLTHCCTVRNQCAQQRRDYKRLRNIRFDAHWQNCEKWLLASSCLSVCSSAWTTRLPLEGLWWNLVFYFFKKSVKKIQVSLKSGKSKG